MRFTYLESNPDYIPPEYVIPMCAVLGVCYWLLGSKQRREARKAMKK